MFGNNRMMIDPESAQGMIKFVLSKGSKSSVAKVFKSVRAFMHFEKRIDRRVKTFLNSSLFRTQKLN